MSSFSTSHIHDPPAEDAATPSGALHHPHEGWQLGCSDDSMVQDPPAGDAVIPSGVSHRPREDQELVSSVLPTWNVVSLSTLLITWELLESSAEHIYHRTLDVGGLRTAVEDHPLSNRRISGPLLAHLASVEIPGEIISNSEWPHFFQQPWCLTYSNSRQSFQYIDQLPDGWSNPEPSFSSYEGSMVLNGPWSPDTLNQ
ncbi:hypothetical protein BS47DRAFT_1367613 [Hydnum rufescens UP504]|uniref:Uncharacterized protein n=1 Tax=Hydnum rufescens UP504 TaxID=1448309 RepID=A0A9P6AHS3_9AGAM|nr:hypothetical protein BS47DRAFT_1367613 [Hydnum rufescens UP504]